MRIQRLDLLAFGPFTERSLDLSQGGEGLHIVHGPNEAGKSSALRAINGLLFGIPNQTTDNFLHPHTELRIGGSLEDEGQVINVIRRKGRSKTIRDRNDDKVIPDEILQEFVGGIDEQTFRTVFGLHHDELVQGGAAIVEGKGNIGEALFSAAAGLEDLRIVLASLDEEAGEVFKARGQTPRINSKLRDLKDARARISSLQLRPNEWHRVHKALHSANADRAELEGKIRLVATRIEHLNRVQKAVPLVAEREELRQALEPVKNVVLLPEDFRERRLALLSSRDHAASVCKDATKTIESIEQAASNLDVDTQLLDQEDLIEELRDLSASNRTALRDLETSLVPERSSLKETANRLIKELDPNLEFDGVHALSLPKGFRERVEALGAASETRASKYANAQSALTALLDSQTRTTRSLDEIDVPSGWTELETTVKRIREKGQLEEQLKEGRHELALVEDRVNKALARLELWSGSLEELELLTAPSMETLERCAKTMSEQQQHEQILESRILELEEEQERHRVKIDALLRERTIPTEDELQKVRGAREVGWRLVRDAWENSKGPNESMDEETEKALEGIHIPSSRARNLGDAFEDLMRAADRIADQLRGEADRVAELSQLRSVEESHKSKLELLGTEATALEQEVDQLNAEWRRLWEPCGIEPNPPSEMLGWLKRRDSLLSEADKLRLKETGVLKIRELIETCIKELSSALMVATGEDFDEAQSLASLVDKAEAALAEIRNAKIQYDRLKDELESLDSHKIPEAQRTLEAARKELDDWKSDWSECMEVLKTSRDSLPPEATAILRQIDAVFSHVEKIAEVEKRISQIQANDRIFRERISTLVKDVASDLADLEADTAISELYARIRQGQKDRTRLETLEERLSSERSRLSEAQADLNEADLGLRDMCREARADEIEELPAREDHSDSRRKLEISLDDVENRLLDLSPGTGLDEFVASISDEEVDEIGPELNSLEREADEHALAIKEKSEEIGRFDTELSQMDGSADAAEAAVEVQSLLAQIQLDAEEYVRLKLAGRILEQAIAQYREKNQGPILSRAGEIFSTLTLGSFESLRTDFGENDEDVLVGVRPGSGKLVQVSGMSDGTSDQLYLALRIASLEQYLDRSKPIPLVLDDILVNFDDDRAAATLMVLAELSARTQVVFFTHHQHLVELAKNVVPKKTLFIQQLS